MRVINSSLVTVNCATRNLHYDGLFANLDVVISKKPLPNKHLPTFCIVVLFHLMLAILLYPFTNKSNWRDGRVGTEFNPPPWPTKPCYPPGVGKLVVTSVAK
ncbi:hypothetical protein PRIPAC_71190, partial [Pristionchus pacificus]|uniref:Transmembrane protein n=1 Tax=Pristionchus pacificus TaxID=54126 RepID=A0A8R1YTT4_PRIPA